MIVFEASSLSTKRGDVAGPWKKSCLLILIVYRCFRRIRRLMRQQNLSDIIDLENREQPISWPMLRRLHFSASWGVLILSLTKRMCQSGADRCHRWKAPAFKAESHHLWTVSFSIVKDSVVQCAGVPWQVSSLEVWLSSENHVTSACSEWSSLTNPCPTVVLTLHHKKWFL